MNVSPLTTYRKQLHQNPELSGQETNTAKQVIETLKTFHPTNIISGIGGPSFVAIFDSGNPGKTIMFRAELDALPIHEVNSFQHRSKVKGVSHKCGHDGHMAILLGLAEQLYSTPIATGKVMLLFQSAEETGEGAKTVLNNTLFEPLKPDFIFALHNVPGYKKGTIICKSGTFTPEVVSLAITLHGKTAHAAEPEKGINPDEAIQQLIYNIKRLANPNEASDSFSTIATVFATLGTKNYGISAGHAELHFTLRCWQPRQLNALKQTIAKTTAKICDEQQLKYTLDWFQEFSANQNNNTATKHIENAANTLKYQYISKAQPFKWGEDFGLFTQHFKGAMFGLGAGENTPALHNPDYDFPDEIIANGVSMFYQILSQTNA
ncbi:hypothetical protein IA57_02845 [Mangrovimonas yunxiaonensis]|uniref:Peptidase M20 dimerisation domain-containing protein n=1 Tax=Mangrovimonas yunxiaonensis TaxID=1197477 RepID=A0A084TM90_9FLAO|nr:amidohydrolase [Mangrovimonas yunxiaonensis]KFB01826.1 hypothetical protein IA57_02845 [Mangrovimonas yunxiaonensis]GGH41228.1 amidohydrolase [Mangrovimonas yunxiaonensis]